MNGRWMLGLLTLLPVAANAATVMDSAPSLIGAALRCTDLDRSIKYYTTGLGMVVARTIDAGEVTNVFLTFAGKVGQPGLLIFVNRAPGAPPTVDHGNTSSRVMFRMPDVAAAAAHLSAAGYPTGEIRNHGGVKVLNLKDPDGYVLELTEIPRDEIKAGPRS